MEKLGVSWALRKAGAMANSTTKIEDVNGDVRIASTSTGEKVDFELIVFERVPLTSTHLSLRHFLRPKVSLFSSPRKPSLRHKSVTLTQVFDNYASSGEVFYAYDLFIGVLIEPQPVAVITLSVISYSIVKVTVKMTNAEVTFRSDGSQSGLLKCQICVKVTCRSDT